MKIQFNCNKINEFVLQKFNKIESSLNLSKNILWMFPTPEYAWRTTDAW